MQGLNEIKALINDLPTHTFPNRDYLMAAFKAHGEFLNAKLLTMIMKKQGFKVRLLTPRQAGLVVTGSPNDASVNPETYVNLRNLELIPLRKLYFLDSMEFHLLEILPLFHVVAQTLPALF